MQSAGGKGPGREEETVMPLVSYLCQIPCWALRIHVGMKAEVEEDSPGPVPNRHAEEGCQTDPVCVQ